ncbi:Uncharacterized protein HA466_0315520 [Hirschfeldia incana]|nr:Uncharacterized protein HA466_0315520 [Hirschfeldia incana]
MGLTNFILTVAGVGAVVMLLKSDVKQSVTVLRRNVKHIRHWLEEETSAASKAAQSIKPKEIETKVTVKDIPKEKNYNGERTYMCSSISDAKEVEIGIRQMKWMKEASPSLVHTISSYLSTSFCSSSDTDSILPFIRALDEKKHQ